MKNSLKLSSALLITLALCSCGDNEDSVSSKIQYQKTKYKEVEVTPLKTRGNHVAEKLFTKLTPGFTNINFENRIDLNEPMKRLYHGGFVCGGVALGDFNQDNKLDIFLVSGSGNNQLYFQTEDFRFIEAGPSSGINGGDAWGSGAAAIDIDGDEDLDIYVCNYDSPNSLFINDGKGNFKDSAKSYGLDIIDASLLPTFCDYDRDGDLDLYLLTNRYYRTVSYTHLTLPTILVV